MATLAGLIGAVATLAGLVAAALSLPPAALAQAPRALVAVPTPEAYLGFEPGEDRRLAEWGQITGYLQRIAETSDRAHLDTIGRSTLGAPFILLTLSDPSNLERLEELREVQARLADPRRISDPDEREDLLRRGRVVILLTTAIHSTEVGSSLVPLTLAYRLAASEEPDVRHILQEAIVLLIPSLNPDGIDLVARWYRSTIDMPWEGTEPPFLYHPYVGHDNNRDWYAFTQQETRIVVREVYGAWHPQIVHDIHQQTADGSRFFVPPWLDPIEPNVDPLLISASNALGTAVAWELHRQGKSGVVVNASFDAWTPARAYPHYHGGVRILSETASARLASPMKISVDQLSQERGFDPRRASWNHPRPWPGGRWGLDDILVYMESGAMALLRHAARYREQWLRNFLAVGERAVAGWESWPQAWVLPAGQEESEGLHEVLRILVTGEVEVVKTRGSFTADGRRFEAGSYVIDMHQPFASFAQALLAPQGYPELRESEDGPLLEPYDATAHAIPLLMGVQAVPVHRRLSVSGERVSARDRPDPRVEGLSDDPGVLVGLYQPWFPSIDEGWTRWLFDRYAVPYETLRNGDVLRGGLIRHFTAIVLPSIGPVTLREGRPPGSLPQRYVGGLGEAGAAELRAFVEAGGTLVALDSAASYAIDALSLPVRDLLEGLDRSRYFAPGSIVRLEVDTLSWLGRGMPARTAAWLDGGLALEPMGPEVRVVAHYGRAPVLLSGLLHGASHLGGRAAMVEIPLGEGRVILFGFRPQYRGQSIATYPLLFNALRRRARSSGSGALR
ncbi:MAG: M14 family zinc carboxypeptidase [Gemmatimonadota bacterium]